MRREKIIKAVNNLREALHAAQIREFLRATKSGQQTDAMNRTQRILVAYNEFTRHYQQFNDEEKDLMNFFGLSPLLDIGFWSGLIDGEQSVNRKMLSDVDVGAYNVIYVMPKLKELLTRESDKGELIISDAEGSEREMKRIRVLVAERERCLTDPQVLINVIRSMDELYAGLSIFHSGPAVGLAIGSIDSGSAKTFDFFGMTPIMDEINALLNGVWDRIKYSSLENFRYQIEVAMMAAGFVTRVKDAQQKQLVQEEQAQRTTRLVAKAIETLFRAGAYTEDMDMPREVRASKLLTPKAQLLEFKQEGQRVDAKRAELRGALESGLFSNGTHALLEASQKTLEALTGAAPVSQVGRVSHKASDILRDLRDQLELKEAVD